MKRLYLAAVLAAPLVLGGCQTRDVSTEQRLVEACQDYERALDAVVTHGELGNLTLEQLETVAKVDAGISPICLGEMTAPDGTPLDASDALRMVEDAYIEFLKLQQQEVS